MMLSGAGYMGSLGIVHLSIYWIQLPLAGTIHSNWVK